MTDIFGKPGKASRKQRLFEIGVQALQDDGWQVQRVPGAGKSSVRRITKGTVSKLVAIRTTQDTWIAFPRNSADTAWATLADVDAVVAVSVDDRDKPKFGQVHVLDGDEMRDRFDRAYEARKAAGRKQTVGRGIWVSLYDRDSRNPISHVGAGAGLDNPPIARVPLLDKMGPDGEDEGGRTPPPDSPLTIAEAKRRLALTFGVDPESVKITIEA